MEYTPLDFGRFEGQFLRLTQPKPNESGNLPQFGVLIESLSYPPGYCALSYFWGDTSKTAIIEISGKEVEVSENLESALRHLEMKVGGLI